MILTHKKKNILKKKSIKNKKKNLDLQVSNLPLIRNSKLNKHINSGGFLPYKYALNSELIFNRNTVYVVLGLLTLSSIYLKLTGKKSIINLVKMIIGKICRFN